MPSRFEVRNENQVKLHCFSNEDVIEYLDSKLNIDKPRFKISAIPKYCNGVMAEIDGVAFILYANCTWIELSFNQEDAKKMCDVIEKITKWDKFSKTEKTFYVEIDEGKSHTIIFENGFTSPVNYQRSFKQNKLKITSF